jgi:hypothetical protein
MISQVLSRRSTREELDVMHLRIHEVDVPIHDSSDCCPRLSEAALSEQGQVSRE